MNALVGAAATVVFALLSLTLVWKTAYAFVMVMQLIRRFGFK